MMPDNVSYLRRRVKEWFRKHGREYPWRQTRDPYKVIVAEMMLRRTRPEQVLRVYQRFVEMFPDPWSLAGADESVVESIVFPLGLRWRTPAFKAMAERLVGAHNGVVPRTKEDLLSLPGVGDYVAGAVMNIAYEEPESAVDANIARLLSRYAGIKVSGEARRNRDVVALATNVLDCVNPRDVFLGMIDLASECCKPREPRCEDCPLQERCSYSNESRRGRR